jgi:hypothetical protein
MADWPGLEELKQVLNISEDDWDNTLTRVLAAAVSKVKGDVGIWDELTDEPDDNMAAAALRMAELMSERPDAVPGTKAWLALSADPTYRTYLHGRRRSFSIA